MLNRNDILSKDDLPVEVVSVPEWGGDVRIRALSGADRDAYQRMLYAGSDTINYDNFRAKLLVFAIVDESNQRIFTDADADALGAKNGDVIGRLYSAAQKLSGVGDAEVNKELEGN